MTWAGRRKAIILSTIGAVVVLLVGLSWFFFFRTAPSCVDNTQNQGEEGIDCGGPCTVQCTASYNLPTVRFARALSPFPGRTDVIAYIDNTNSEVGASNVGYTVELYDSRNTLVAKKEGTMSFTPSATVPLFVPNLSSGSSDVTRVFVTIDQNSLRFVKGKRYDSPLSVTDVVYTAGDSPRVTAMVRNSSASSLRNVTYIATLFATDGNAIAASSTLVPEVPAQGGVPIVFTWPEAIPGTVARIEVLQGIAGKP